MTYKSSLCQYIKDFTLAMLDRCEIKAIKYGSAWKVRPVESNEEYSHQNERFYQWFKLKLDGWRNGGANINWVDVAVEAMICWIREEESRKNPE